MNLAILVVAAVISAGSGAVARPSLREEGDDVLVTTETGVVRGVVARSLNGTLYNRFVGIPFAAPPVGDLRFRPPQPAANWTGVRDALEYSSECPQAGGGSEDCLYINVFVPLTSTETSPFAVMVNIYGGAFTAGSANRATPDYFMDKGVALVSFNYRVGSVGFLSLQNEDIPGNAGLKDQVFALKWVQRNIANFGGDRDRVTIFGASAGGCSTSHLFISPFTKGLFHGAILESGESSSPWGIEPVPREKAYRLAASLGFQPGGTDDDQQVADFLRSVDHADLTRDDYRANSDFENRRLSRLAFVPVLEPPSDTAVVTQMPADVIREGRYNKVPVITGVTSADGSVIVGTSGVLRDAAFAADLRENFTELVGSQLLLPTQEERDEAARRINSFYFGDQGFNTDDEQAVYDMTSDMYFIQPSESLARKLTNDSSAPVYLYYFDYDGYGSTEYGMGHAATSRYLFMMENGGPNKDPESADGKVLHLITTLWTNFAKYGVPAENGNPVTWERQTESAAHYLDMKSEFVNRQDLLKERMDFWRDIYSSAKRR